jgi:hypothetical protein
MRELTKSELKLVTGSEDILGVLYFDREPLNQPGIDSIQLWGDSTQVTQELFYEGWTLRSENESVFHGYDQGNRVWTKADGLGGSYEIVHNANGELVTGQLAGSYNIFDPNAGLLSAVGHGIVDTTTFLIMDNSPQYFLDPGRFTAVAQWVGNTVSSVWDWLTSWFNPSHLDNSYIDPNWFENYC